ncbi:MAG: alpha/beta hydrolase [Patescibacteria group bacterium]
MVGHVVIIPGAKTKHPKLLDPFLKKYYYDRFGIAISNQGRAWVPIFSDWLENMASIPVSVFDWTGGVSATSVLLAARKLAAFIDACSHHRLILFAKSMGGNVADYGVRLAKHPNKVKKIIYIATPHQPINLNMPGHILRINVYSPEDNYIDFANRTLYMGFGKKHLPDVKNVVLPKVRHGQFMTNVLTEYQGRPIQTFDLFKKLIEE